MVFRPESQEMDQMDRGAVPSETMSSNQNVSDFSGADVAEVSAGKSLSLQNGQDGFYPLEDFLERPVEIATGSISVGSGISAIYPVWDIVTKHPSFRAKIKNFAYMRANLKVRISVSGSPFHTGRILVTYQPHAGKNRNIAAHLSNLTAAPTYKPMFLNYLSQAEGAQVIDVRANQPLEMMCPYISPKPMCRLFNASSSALSAATSLTDFVDMGSLTFHTINNIGSVSAGSSSVGYNIFAWLEDVEICVPTATHMAITTESKDMSVMKSSKKDERETGPVERISSALVDVAEAASMVPGLELYAAPAAIVFQGISTLAAHFGWSRPRSVGEPTYVKNRPYSNSSICIGSETSEPLSYDPKRELAADGWPCGSSTDDMAIVGIATRESYMETFTWAASDAAYTSIKSYIVHPQMNTYHTDAGATPCTLVQPSAMSFAVTPFDYWRGDITYRLDFVTSQYHRGKLAIWYEPNGAHEALISADLALNKNNVQIIDIATTNSVEITVKWANSFPWLKTIPLTSIRGLHTPSVLIVNLTTSINGYIVIAPFVPLQSPDASNVQVNVFVRAENLLVESMNQQFPTQRVLITPESMDISLDEVTRVDLNPSDASVADITKHYFGELPLSFRACLKRYQTVENASYVMGATGVRMRGTRSIMPEPTPKYNGPATVSPNFSNLYSYLRYAYLGFRGGIRNRIRVYDFKTHTLVNQLMISLGAESETVTESTDTSTTLRSTYNRGDVQFTPHISGNAEVEFPFYTQNNFVFSFADDLMGSAIEGEMSRSWAKRFELTYEGSYANTDVVYIVRDMAAAEDTSFLRFCGAPYYTY